MIVILGITVISFVLWVPNIAQRGGGGGNDYGTIYGEKITQNMYAEADHDIRLLYLFRYGQWPERIPNLSKSDLQSQIFGRILMMIKARQLGVYVSPDDVASAADQMLRSPELSQQLGFKGRSIPFDDFLKGILQPEGLGADDFQHFVRDDLTIHQLVSALGLAGSLITPQEGEQLYQREHQPISAQAVFFSYSNYLSGITVTPAALGEFYTNHLAEYRLPDRVQISYVAFEITNFIPAAEKQIGKTNLDYEVENLYRQNGMSAVPGAKTPDEAKAAIREMVLKREAAAEATQKAKDFATTLFAMDPPRPQNLATLAGKEGLTVKSTAPFNSQYGPEEFLAPAALTRAAFEMTPDVPLAGPIPGSDALYVIALDKQLPSEIPSFQSIRSQVTADYRREEARARALAAGTNFVARLQPALASGKSFTAVCAADGVHAETLSPFSLSTQEIPELGGRDVLNEMKQTAFSTPDGHASGLMETDDGGFVLYVKSRLAVDPVQMRADLPQFLETVRRQREQEAFNVWLNTEASRELQHTALARELPAHP